MKSKILIFIILLFVFQTGISQNQANIWHFGDYTGLDFNTGEPQISPSVTLGYDNASATICDEEGNFLFSTNALEIVNKNGMTMPNGDGILGRTTSSQGALIVQKPGSNNLYYVFTISPLNYQIGLHYSIVDINLDGGLGDVTNQKNVFVDNTLDAIEKLIAVRHANNKDIWIVVRKFTEDSFAAFLLTENGLETEPVISPTIDRDFIIEGAKGTMKVSYDKKYLVAAYWLDGGGWYYKNVCFDINKFNSITGQIEFMYRLNKNTFTNPDYEPMAVEFSPDSKLLYTTVFNDHFSSDEMEVYQYEMQYIEDSLSFV